MIKLNSYVLTMMLILSFLFVGCSKNTHKLNKKIGLSAYKYAKYPHVPYYYLNGIYYYGGYYDNGVYHYGKKLYNQGYYYYDGYRYANGQRIKEDKGKSDEQEEGYHERLRHKYYKKNTTILKKKEESHTLEYYKLKSIPTQ